MIWYKLIHIVFITFSICSLSIFSVDFYFWLKERYCRYHIGRWARHEEWLTAIIKIANKWVMKTPTVKITDNCRLILIDMLTGKYRSSTIQVWQKAGLLLGLSEQSHFISSNRYSKILNSIISVSGNWIIPPKAVECGILAYAILKNTKDVEFVKPAMDYAVTIIKNHIREDEMVCYTFNDIDNRYVDTLGMICPFLVLYANTYNEPQYKELAYIQIMSYEEYGLLNNYLLPVHAYNFKNKLPLGIYGWGRGVAWYLLSIIDTYLELKEEIWKINLKQHIKQIADCLINFQNSDGGFGSIIQLDYTYDSSATSVIGYFYSRCYDLFADERYLKVSILCLNKLKTVTRYTGEIDWCQGDTKGIGVHSKTYDIMPFAQGMTIRLALINRNRR